MSCDPLTMHQLLERAKARAAAFTPDYSQTQQADLVRMRASLMQTIRAAHTDADSEKTATILSKLVPIVLKVIALERNLDTDEEALAAAEISNSDRNILAHYVKRVAGDRSGSSHS